MGRTSEHEKTVEKEKKLNKDQIIAEKLNKEDISSEELAVVMLTKDRSVRDMVKKFCKEHDGFNIEDFKEGKSYRFKANCNGIITTLLELTQLAQYDKRKEQHTIEEQMDRSEILINGIEKYMSDSDKNIIKKDLKYKQLEMEKKLYKNLMRKITQISDQLGMMPSLLRFQVMAEINKKLDYVPHNIAKKHASYIMEKNLYKEQIKKEYENKYEVTFQKDLEEYLVSILKTRLKGLEKNKDKEAYTIEEKTRAWLEQMVVGNMKSDENEEVKIKVENSKQILLEHPEVKSVMQKIADVLNPDIPLENDLLGWIEYTTLLFTIATNNNNNNHDESLGLGKEILRRSVTEEVYRNLQKITNSKMEAQ